MVEEFTVNIAMASLSKIYAENVVFGAVTMFCVPDKHVQFVPFGMA